MHLFYSNQISDTEALLSLEESLHALKTLRHRAGDVVHITDGQGNLFQGHIAGQKAKECIVLNLEKLPISDIRPPIHLFISMPKNPERFEWFLEKTTEIGVGSITPLNTHRSEKHFAKYERWQKILISALKQSGRLYLPKLLPAQKMEWVVKSDFNTKLIAHCISDIPRSPISELPKSGEICLLIGPEGDFTSDEVNKALQNGFNSVSLGTARLRTETAGVVGCTLLNF